MAVNAKNWQEMKKPNALEKKVGGDSRRKATFEALGEQTSPKSVAQRRGKKIADLMARREGVAGQAEASA
ncbi:MAG TPA: hypothetical protein VJS15_01170, partial [Allosphingosinicella sp.]|nr:hypothetical protein [Allosphingosinicella sp.]